MSNPKVAIVEERCVGCRLCEKACPFGAISIRNGKAEIDYDACTICGACAPVCTKFDAILYEPLTAKQKIAKPVGDVWVFCEVIAGTGCLNTASAELLNAAACLAKSVHVHTAAVLIGDNLDRAVHEAASFGAEKIFVTEHPRLQRYDDQSYAKILCRLIKVNHPEILLGGATAVGRALLPRVAVQVHTGLTADCTDLHIDAETGLLQQTRPAFGGNILATITCAEYRPQMATVRPGVLPRPSRISNPRADVTRIAALPEELEQAVKQLDFMPRADADLGLRDADTIVTAGYGTGGPNGVKLVKQLADFLGAALGASRAVVDAGWLDYPHQVGQTGTTVQPKLYIACGVSGAIQHLVGMQNSDTIVAINRDPDALIFAYADFAIVGDLGEIIPEMLQQLKANRRGEK